jgi:hypothetical protein
MTFVVTTLASIAAATVIALAGVTGSATSDPPAPRTALVVDAAVASSGRVLVDPRLREVDAEVRLPRTAREARTNVRYFSTLGYRVVVAGPRSRAAADAVGIDAVRTAGLARALARL